MNGEHRSRVEALYAAALRRDPAVRPAFLAAACGADSALRREVESRLSETSDSQLDDTRAIGSVGEPRSGEWAGLHLLAEIGSGAFGRVYRARDPVLARDVALKVIALRHAEDAATVLREGQMIARVRHPNVVTVYAAERVGDEVGLTMELVDGMTLSDVVRQQGPMGPGEAAVIGLSLCRALAAVHAAGLVHRDVKARNVMRERGGRLVLMDFGLGREAERRQRTTTTDLSGTPPYMAPELFDGRRASAASDLYSLGVLLFFLVTREYPVHARTLEELARAHASGQRRLLADVRPDLPLGFVRVVEQALSPDPERRYATAATMMHALAQAISESSGVPIDLGNVGSGSGRFETRAPSGPTADEQPWRKSSRRRAALWVGALGAGVLGVGALGLLTSTTFNLALGRRDGFSDDTVRTWWEYGARSLVTPLAYAALTIALIIAIRAGLRIVRPSSRPLSERSGVLAKRLGLYIGIRDVATAGQWLLVLQVIVLLAIIWSFLGVLRVVVTFPDGVDRDALSLLSVTSSQPILYRQALSVALVLMLLAWRAVLHRPGASQEIDAGTKAGALAVMIVTLLLLELPYRVMFHSDRPVVEHEGLSCYEMGRRTDDVLVYCPAWDQPRIRTVGDRSLVRDTGIRGDLFSSPEAPGR